MKKEISFALRRTAPVMIGYLFLGIAFGLMLHRIGYSFIWAGLISLFVYGGSAQFALVGLLSSGASIITTAVMQLSINSRHIFYGLSFIEKFKLVGKKRPYMIFSLTDETYALLCSTVVPDDMDEKKVVFFIALFDHIYWVIGSALGGMVGQLIPFNSSGVEFAMTALFVVIFVEQWLAVKNRFPAVTGIICGIVSFLIFGPSNFLLPALIASVVVLILIGQLPRSKEVRS